MESEVHMSEQPPSSPERRSFLTRLNAGTASISALAMGGIAMAQVKSAPVVRWAPARHDKDDWMDQLPSKHRLLFDTTSEEGVRNALLFANNFLIANRDEYSLENKDLAVIIVVRHLSTAFGYNNQMWAKYGVPIAARSNYVDPKSKEAPKVNVHAASLDSLSKQGVQFAVCSMATRALAGLIAEAVGGNSEAINSELIANLVNNGRMVPAGIVAVNRAQERGYSLVSA
jgi:intracellular sulfur oxidation DsrE/DsrF family protein